MRFLAFSFLCILLTGCLTRRTPSFYQQQVAPILKRACSECHGGKVQKGELDLQTISGLQRGGKSGSLIVWGEAEKSLLFECLVSEDEDLLMPPPGAEAGWLEDEEIQLIKWWINAGVGFEKPTSELSLPADLISF